MQCVVLTPGVESSATWVSLMALTGHIDSVTAIPPGRNCFLLMLVRFSVIRLILRNSQIKVAAYLATSSIGVATPIFVIRPRHYIPLIL